MSPVWSWWFLLTWWCFVHQGGAVSQVYMVERPALRSFGPKVESEKTHTDIVLKGLQESAFFWGVRGMKSKGTLQFFQK